MNIKVEQVTRNIKVNVTTQNVIVRQQTSNIQVNQVGRRGSKGEKGDPGDTGAGVTSGGTTGQILAKASDTNYDTEWVDQSGALVSSVNSQTGDVVLDTDDIADTSTNRYTNDSDTSRLANTSGTNTGDQDLSAYAETADLATVATTGDYDDLINKPTIPTVPVTSVAGRTGNVVLTSTDVGLVNVNDTSDADKPISTATQTALNGKFTQRTITGTTNQVTVTNGDGVSGNPTLALPQNIHTGASPSFVGLTLTGDITQTKVTPMNKLINTSTTQFTGSTQRYYNNGVGFGNNAGFRVGQTVSDVSGTLSRFSIDVCDYTGGYNRDVFRVDLSPDIAKFSMDVAPISDSTKALGTSSLYWSNTYTDRLYLNSTAYADGATAGQFKITGLLMPVQATTAGAPAYVKGAIYFDTTLNKLRVGGATAWETITSA